MLERLEAEKRCLQRSLSNIQATVVVLLVKTYDNELHGKLFC